MNGHAEKPEAPRKPMPNLTPEQERRIAAAPARPWVIPANIKPIY